MFDARYLELVTRDPVRAPSISETSAGLIQQVLGDALSSRRSLVLEATFADPATVAGVSRAFAESGFSTRVVIAAARRADSLLASAIRYLWERHARLPATFTSRQAHDSALQSTRALADSLAASPPVDRVSVFAHDGALLYDSDPTAASPFPNVRDAIRYVDSARWTPGSAAAWFNDLRRATDFARADRELQPPVAELLLELHRIGLNEVLPAMPFRPESPARVEQERRLAAEIVELRQHARTTRPDRPAAQPATGPVVQPPSPGGPSL